MELVLITLNWKWVRLETNAFLTLSHPSLLPLSWSHQTSVPSPKDKPEKLECPSHKAHHKTLKRSPFPSKAPSMLSRETKAHLDRQAPCRPPQLPASHHTLWPVSMKVSPWFIKLKQKRKKKKTRVLSLLGIIVLIAPVSPNTAENSYTFLLWTILLLETPSHKLYDGWRESVHLAALTMSKRTKEKEPMEHLLF